MTDGLPEWLRAQLDEDAAKIADPRTEKAWHARDCESLPEVLYPDRETGTCDCGVPARLLREIDAKRQALDHYAEFRRLATGGERAYRLAAGAVAMQIQIMALPYADRPGYDEAWRP